MSGSVTWAYSADGNTAEIKGRNLPRTLRLSDGTVISGLSPQRATEFGWFPLRREPRQPYDDGYPTRATVEGNEAVLRPLLPTDEIRLQRAMVGLDWRLTSERNRQVSIASTGIEHTDELGNIDTVAVEKAQLRSLMYASTLNMKLARGTATADDLATMDLLASIPPEIQQIEIQTAALRAWVQANITTWEAADAFDPATPPMEAPQWPV